MSQTNGLILRAELKNFWFLELKFIIWIKLLNNFSFLSFSLRPYSLRALTAGSWLHALPIWRLVRHSLSEMQEILSQLWRLYHTTLWQLNQLRWNCRVPIMSDMYLFVAIQIARLEFSLPVKFLPGCCISPLSDKRHQMRRKQMVCLFQY